jgi:cytochrome c-type biogenesis protein CcmH/NrfG
MGEWLKVRVAGPHKRRRQGVSETEKKVAEEVSFRARSLELELRERVDNNTSKRLDSLANFVGIVAAVVFGVFGLGTYLLVQNLVQGAIAEGTAFDARLEARFERLERSLQSDMATELARMTLEELCPKVGDVPHQAAV